MTLILTSIAPADVPKDATDQAWETLCKAWEAMRDADDRCEELKDENPDWIGGYGDIGKPPANPLQAAERRYGRTIDDYSDAASAVVAVEFATPLDIARQLHAATYCLESPEVVDAQALRVATAARAWE